MSLRIAKCIEKSSRLLLSNTKILTTVRSHWNQYYKPGPYPLTEQERLAAAKKYGVHPAEYIPYNDDGTGYGDYPKLKAESGDSRDPFYPWDIPALKRNFNEPMHVEFDLMREDRYDVNAKYHPSCVMKYLQFIGVMSASYFLFWLCDFVKCFHPVLPKQYALKDKKYYTFEQE